MNWNRNINYSVSIDLSFCAGHRIQNHLGKCRNVHGHNYDVSVEVEATGLDENGMVVDFSDLKQFVRPLIELLDHAMLLEETDPLVHLWRDTDAPMLGMKYFLMDGPPTAERIAELLLREINRSIPLECPKVTSVTVEESGSSAATAVLDH